MSLPKINAPEYRLNIPSTDEEITYRPFLVKEEKLLLIAHETGDEKATFSAIKQLIKSCVIQELAVDTLPMFDIEYIFLKIRGKSVGEKIDLMLTCPDDEVTTVPVQVDIDEISVLMNEEHTNEVEITDNIKIVFRYPLLKDIKEIPANTSEMDLIFTLLYTCIDSISHGEEIYNQIDVSNKEIEEFIDSLTGDQFEKVTNFFQTMPKLRHVIPITNPKTGVESEVVVEGLASFLG